MSMSSKELTSMITIAKAIVFSTKNQIPTKMYPTCPFSLKPEYVDEMTVDAETELQHKAWCVRKLLGNIYTLEELRKYCALYGITTEQALNC